MSNTSDIIEKDKLSHPNCTYSYSNSRTSNSISRNGEEEVVCKVLEQIRRICPNQAPQVIYSVNKTDTQKGNSSIDAEDNFAFHQNPEIFPSMNSIFRDFFGKDKLLQEFKGSCQDKPQRKDNSIWNNNKGKKKDHDEQSFPFQGDVVGPTESI